MKTERNIDNDCEKATFLIEKKQLEAISPVNAAELEIHLADCIECRIFQKQSKLINKTCRKLLTRQSGMALRLDADFKNILQSQIDRLLGKAP